MHPWRNGSAVSSEDTGCEFKSRWVRVCASGNETSARSTKPKRLGFDSPHRHHKSLLTDADRSFLNFLTGFDSLLGYMAAAKVAMRDRLLNGETITQYKEGGSSMVPLLHPYEPVDIRPIDRDVVKGDIVFCRIGRRYYCHLVTGVKEGRYQISNNHGHINGYTTADKIYGFVSRSKG